MTIAWSCEKWQPIENTLGTFGPPPASFRVKHFMRTYNENFSLKYFAKKRDKFQVKKKLSGEQYLLKVDPGRTFVTNNIFERNQYFSNFSCMFLNPNIFSNFNSNCSNLLNMIRTSYRNERNTEALIIENLEPVEITKKLFQHHLNILKNV